MLRHHTCETAVGRPVFLVPGDVYGTRKKTYYVVKLVDTPSLFSMNFPFG